MCVAAISGTHEDRCPQAGLMCQPLKGHIGCSLAHPRRITLDFGDALAESGGAVVIGRPPSGGWDFP